MTTNTNITGSKELPFFIILGRPRSGTTLLRTLLDAHPNVTIPVECPLLMRMYGKYGRRKQWDTKVLNSFFNDLFKIVKFENWIIDKEKLKANLLKMTGHYTYMDICKVVFSNYISFYPKNEVMVLGDKNPAYSKFAKRVSKMFPEARYIHITRDYRDHILSMLNVGLAQPLVSFLAYQWKLSFKTITRLSKKKPESFYTLRYEDLVLNTEVKLREICNFLSIEYDPVVLNYAERQDEFNKIFDQETLDRYADSLFKPIKPDRIGLWKKALKEKDIKMADVVLGSCSEKAGYERKYKNFSLLCYIKATPAITLIRLNYLRRFAVSKMPVNMRRAINNGWKSFTRVIYKKLLIRSK